MIRVLICPGALGMLFFGRCCTISEQHEDLLWCHQMVTERGAGGTGGCPHDEISSVEGVFMSCQVTGLSSVSD